jgi:hypothetical protein
VVQGADVVLVGGEQLQTRVAVRGAGDGIAVAGQFLLDQPRQAAVVVDVEQTDGAGQSDR